MQFQEIQSIIEQGNKNIVVTMHARPDADALGSSLALARVLNKMGHVVTAVAPTDFPEFLNGLEGAKDVVIYSRDSKNADRLLENADAIFCLDYSSLNRLNDMADSLLKSKAIKIVIDHHKDSENFAEIMIVDIASPATAILVFRLFKNLHLQKFIDPQIADCLYAGIMTDTGSFQNANTTAEAHMVTAKLVEYGANIYDISKQIYNTNSINKLKFLGFAFTERLTIMTKYNTAYFTLKKEDWNNFNLKTGDTEGLVNFALSLKEIFVAALIADKGDYVRISLRSSGDIAVNEIAKTYFEGGGHKNAAGGKSTDSLENTVQKFEDIIKTKLYPV